MDEDDTDARSPQAMLAKAEDMYRLVAHDLHSTVMAIKRGELGDAKLLGPTVRELRAAFHTAMEERGRVEKLRKQDDGAIHAYALDFASAREEIARRLDRIGAARGD